MGLLNLPALVLQRFCRYAAALSEWHPLWFITDKLGASLPQGLPAFSSSAVMRAMVARSALRYCLARALRSARVALVKSSTMERDQSRRWGWDWLAATTVESQ